MKKRTLWLLLLVLALAVVSIASAETLVNEPDRNIKPVDLQKDGNFALNPVIEGESPTTGLLWEGRYQPILVQFDNAYGGVDKVRHWGIDAADVVYETPLAANGTTRISALFSDQLPEAAGPVRSSRLAHAWLRQEWQAGFCFYGVQTAEYTNVREEFTRLGVRSSMCVLFDGSAGSNKPWKKYYTRVSGMTSPHNAEVNVAAVQNLIDPAVYAATPRPFLFRDDKPTEGDYAEFIWIENRSKQSVSPSYEYNVDENAYYRFVGGEPYYDMEIGPEEGHQAYANVIVQRCETSYQYGGSCPITAVALKDGVAKGNADIFTGGRYIAGYWMRTGMDERTVFLDANGKEIALQRGKTFIQVTDNKAEVTYSCDEDVMEQLLAEAQAAIDSERAAEDTDLGDDISEAGDAIDAEAEETVEEETQTAEAEEVMYDEPVEGKATTAVNIRKGPSKSKSVLGKLKKGAKIQVIGENGDWYVVKYKKKKVYVMKEFLNVE